MRAPFTSPLSGGVTVVEVPTGTVIEDPAGIHPDITVDDTTVAVRYGTMFVTEKVYQRLCDAIPEARP